MGVYRKKERKTVRNEKFGKSNWQVLIKVQQSQNTNVYVCVCVCVFEWEKERD